jgi:hypothetical protein
MNTPRKHATPNIPPSGHKARAIPREAVVLAVLGATVCAAAFAANIWMDTGRDALPAVLHRQAGIIDLAFVAGAAAFDAAIAWLAVAVHRARKRRP